MTWIDQTLGPTAPMSHVLSVLAGGYLLGCLAVGYYLVRLRLGRDIREMESGSVGARNVARVLGWPGFIITVNADFWKGALAVWLTRHYAQDERLAGLAVVAVVLGHVWPLQLGFRGGKGVATSLGALAVYNFPLALGFVPLFAVFLLMFRRTTPAGLAAFTCLPVVAWFMEPQPWRPFALSVLVVTILIAHRRNLMDEFTHLAARRHIEPETDQPE